MTIFKEGQIVKRNDTGEQVQIVDVLPLGHHVAYRIEYQNGDTSVVLGSQLRPATPVA